MIVPTASLEPLASKLAGVLKVGEEVKEAVGGTSTVTIWVVVSPSPLLLVTISVTRYLPEVAYAWLMVVVLPASCVVPSPKSQL